MPSIIYEVVTTEFAQYTKALYLKKQVKRHITSGTPEWNALQAEIGDHLMNGFNAETDRSWFNDTTQITLNKSSVANAQVGRIIYDIQIFKATDEQ